MPCIIAHGSPLGQQLWSLLYAQYPAGAPDAEDAGGATDAQDRTGAPDAQDRTRTTDAQYRPGTPNTQHAQDTAHAPYAQQTSDAKQTCASAGSTAQRFAFSSRACSSTHPHIPLYSVCLVTQLTCALRVTLNTWRHRGYRKSYPTLCSVSTGSTGYLPLQALKPPSRAEASKPIL